MDYVHTGVFLMTEWVKTFLIFTIVDRIIVGQKIIDNFKNHNTYIASLLVAAFLIITRTQQLSIGSMLFWGIIIMICYQIIKKIKDVFIKS
ncbi:hypothetical protein SAMN05660297_01889 [Natronincola peptidivorans]|uniref:Uncharacterized protein n=1 Tax=Natronincola peptidivorans TaxID=426128 RepID=A0A1I0D8L8_9FIRM|nr:hypothetical protein [Natronincola peptidivorans]SET27873.1 hypothetical protein SAMN05660297_01889 [Natronincola peptidivorans]